MKLIQVLDSDDARPPNTEGCVVFTVNRPIIPLTKRMLEMKFPTVFTDGLGKLEGEHHIRLGPSMDPVQQAPQHVQIALRAKQRESLDDLVCQEVLAPVSEPTPWISSMVFVPKQNGNLRICLDPKDLNSAILCEHYPLPTIEDRAIHLHGAKVLTTSIFAVASVISLWMRSRLRSQLSTHLLVSIGGRDYHLESALLQKCFNAKCIN